MPEATELVITRREGNACRITLNHPPLNILSVELRRQLLQAIEQVERSPNVRFVIVQAAGEKAFSVGSDLTEFPHDEAGGREKIEFERFLLDKIERLNAITFTALHGYVLGGGAELMLACDLRIAADDVRIGFPEVKVGGFPAAGGTWRLVRDVGPTRAKEMLFLGKTISGQEAAAIGLINTCVPKQQLTNTVEGLVAELSELPQSSLLAMKRAILHAAMPSGMAPASSEEIDDYGKLFRGSDIFEGIRAFLEKRRPHFNKDLEKQ